MKVLVINGSPHVHGCTAAALDEVIAVLNAEGIETEILQVGNKDVRGCIACGTCGKKGSCVFDYASPNGTVLSFLDRLFYSTRFSKQMKVGAAVVSCRRGGNTAAFDALNKYFSISGMAIAAGTYWNMVHGFTAEDVKKDLEGLQTMRNLGRNMAFLIKAIAAAKEKDGLPEMEWGAFTSFPDGK